MYKIDKNIPIKTIRRNIYPFEDMAVGDSFFVPFEADGDRQETVQIGSKIRAAFKTSRLKDRKITVRKVSGGLRCWRFK